ISITATGGSSDGGDVSFDAGDNVTVIRTVDVSSAAGGGSGGFITIDAGDDFLGGVAAGGTVTVQDPAVLRLIGSATDTFGGLGGSIDVLAGKSFTMSADIDLTGTEGGGEFDVDAGGTITTSKQIVVEGAVSTSQPGIIGFTAGQARGGVNGALTVNNNILAK